MPNGRTENTRAVPFPVYVSRTGAIFLYPATVVADERGISSSERFMLCTPVPVRPRPNRLFPTLAPRTARILVVLLAVVAMSVADLHMTLTMLTTVGFAEENPIARAVISVGSPALLTVWKMSTVGVAALLLLKLRRHLAAEAGAWVALAVLAGVMMHWHAYVAESHNLVRALHLLEAGMDERWIAMTPR